ncbi:MAG TPA: glycosyltransferase [Armatimonadetes bacterium]|nr:glycosyltransferase [Armatimonadota bacterium]
MATSGQPTLSVVIPIYNEEQCIDMLYERLTAALADVEGGYEIVFANDGSHDRSEEMLRELISRDERLSLVNLSRNFGHQPAISAGLAQAAGRCVVIMDGDLQDPPEVIPELLAKWREGNMVVLAHRRSRREGVVRAWLYRMFYALLGSVSDYPIPLDAGVFGLIDRRVADQLRNLTEHNRFLPGLRAWVGFSQAVVPYDRDERAAGRPKQSLIRLTRYALDAVFSFSYKPLRLSLAVGLAISIPCLAYATILVVKRILGVDVVKGFTTPTVAILFLGGVQLISIGILGEYIGRVYDEVKARPLYIISEVFRKSNATDAAEGDG